MASKHATIVEEIKRQIIDSVFVPGARLPSQLALSEKFGVAGVTVQMALKQLEREGFIETRSRTGTFVVETPPHINQYALVFTFDPRAQFVEERWSRYYQAWTQAAVGFQHRTGLRMLMLHGIDEHAESADRQRLMAEIARQRLAGLIFTNQPFRVTGTPILDQPGLPRVAVSTAQQYPHVPVVTFDGALWIDKALDHLATLGRRRVAMLDFGMEAEFVARLKAGLAARGMISHPCWTQYVNLRRPEGARHAVELLMRDRERPDALLVEDDNFVEHALAGISASGVRAPEDVAIVGHANFPAPPAKLLPVRLLGYDVNAVLQTCVDLIDRQRRGERVPGLTVLPALWEEEVRGQRSISDCAVGTEQAAPGGGRTGSGTGRA